MSDNQDKLARLLEIHVIASRHNLRPDTRAPGVHYDNSPATVAINAAVKNPAAVAARLAARDAGWAAFVHGGTEAMRALFDAVMTLVEDRFHERASDALDTFWDGIGDGGDVWGEAQATGVLPEAVS